jgi:lysophospholipase L1-like esterase
MLINRKLERMFARSLLLVLTVLLAGCNGQPEMQALPDHAVILAFGDSITYGTGASRDAAYPARLQSLTGFEVINAGVPGEVSRLGLRRLPGLLQRHRPDLVIICHGGNDILRRQDLEKTRANIAGMIELSRNAGAQIMLIGVPRFGLFLNSAPFYAELAGQASIPLENDVLGDVLRKPSLKADQVHPNADGYALMAERITDLLAETGAIHRP